MGYMRHHAIVLTSWSTEHLNNAHNKATDLGMLVTPITKGAVNGYRSFLVAPDGSKEGWDESEDGDRRRTDLVEWLESQRTEDGGTYIDWVEVQFGDEGGDTRVIRDSDQNLR